MTGSDDRVPGVHAPGAEEAALNLGTRLGLDPQPALAQDHADGVVVTRSWSWWNGVRCRTCGHTFRRGDRALVVAAARTVQHLVPGLVCGTDPRPGADRGTAEQDELAAGLLATWPADVPISRLAPDDWRIPRPGRRGSTYPPACLYCGHSFRAGEYVVICPCAPRLQACGAAVHRDPVAGLPCWDSWRPEGELAVCPTTMARL
jgi:hypothetical protein